jgi:hypothetical protein
MKGIRRFGSRFPAHQLQLAAGAACGHVGLTRPAHQIIRHKAADLILPPLLRCIAPPPDSRTAIVRGASILLFIGILGLSATEARMLKNVVPMG